MPEYLYTCPEQHEATITERMLYSTGHVCAACGLEMWRKPQITTVVWGGLAPSEGEPAPAVRELIDTADERRDKFEELHEEHERATS